MYVINNYKDDDIIFHYSIDKCPDEKKYLMHAHEWYELFYFINGKGRYMIEGTEYNLEPATTLIMRPAETHKLYIDSSRPYERVVIEFSERIIKCLDSDCNLLKAYNDRPLGYGNKYDRTNLLHGLTDYISDICILNLPPETKRLNAITNLLAILNQINISFKKIENGEFKDTGTDLSKELIEYINLNLYGKLSLKQLSDRFYYSQSHLSRIFKESTGSSIAEYISIKRLLEARRRIQAGSPAAKAARECGFHDYSAFFRAYKKKFDTSPININKYK